MFMFEQKMAKKPTQRSGTRKNGSTNAMLATTIISNNNVKSSPNLRTRSLNRWETYETWKVGGMTAPEPDFK